MLLVVQYIDEIQAAKFFTILADEVMHRLLKPGASFYCDQICGR